MDDDVAQPARLNDSARAAVRRVIAEILRVHEEEIPADAWRAFEQGGFDNVHEWIGGNSLDPSLLDLAADAQQAWEDGLPFYAPTLKYTLRAGIRSVNSGSVTRNVAWERMLGVITTAGWRLQSLIPDGYETGRGNVKWWRVTALFER